MVKWHRPVPVKTFISNFIPVKSSVPWTGFDVLLLFAFWLAPLIANTVIAYTASQTESATDMQNHGHPIVQLVEQSEHSPVIFLIVFLSAVVTAPIVEEFMCRMLLQGWLEAKFKQLQVPCASAIAIGIVSLCFAAMHVGNRNHDVFDAKSMIIGLVISSIFSMIVFVAGIFYLSSTRNVRITEYLFGTGRFFRPGFFACARYCLLTVVLCITLNAVLAVNFPGTNVAPISIFFFALALGILYSRTQNLLYCILLHASLNGISLTLLWCTSRTV